MRRALLLLTLLTIATSLWLVTPRAWAYHGYTVERNGDPSNRVDLVVLGDGYTLAELSKFHQDVNLVIQHLFSETPLKEYRTYFNVHAVEVISPESGADHPYDAPPVYRQTALDAQYLRLYDDPNDRTTYITYIAGNTARMLEVAATDSPAPADVILVLVNDPATAGGAWSMVGMAAMSADGLGPAMAAHEFGHAFAGLGDESAGAMGTFFGSGGSGLGQVIEANLSTTNDPVLVKWKAWFDPTKPIPTMCPATCPLVCPADVVGIFEGAAGFTSGIWKPTCASKMSNVTAPWGQVNASRLLERIYDFVTENDD